MSEAKKVAGRSRSKTRKKTERKKSSKPLQPTDVFQILRERIADQKLPPGSKLKEVELANEFGVSRAKVREAFVGLEERGLIERIPNRGAIVTRLTAKQVLELYDALEVLEGLAVRLATEKNPPQFFNDLKELFGQSTEDALKAGEFEVYLKAVTTFRKRVVERSEHELLDSLLDSILERTTFLFHRLVLVPGRAEQGLREYRAVVEAMSRGDAEEAERLKRENVKSARECFNRYEKFIL
jgi:DNA-binding GntR family transcriptional regulator